MSEGGIAGRRSIDRRTAGRAAVAIGVMVILAATLGPAALTTHPTDTFPSATQVAARATSSAQPGPTATLGPTEDPQAWADLAVPAFELAAAFEPSDRDRGGVATNSSFTVRSLSSTPAVELAKGLHIDPPIGFTIKPGGSADLAVVKPSSALVEGVRYRVRLDAPDGALAGSWAFTTRAPLHVVTTLPADHATDVPTNTGIEIEFDQDGTSGFADHFAIEPAVPGRFEQHDRTWVFVPTKPLAAATIYSVTVRAGVALDGSTATLESAVSFRFETAATTSDSTRLAFGRVMFEARPGDRLAVPTGHASYDFEDSAPTAATVDIHRIPTFAATLAAAAALAGPDSWALNAPSAVVNTSGMTLVGRVEGRLLDSGGGLTLRLPFEPSAGAYILTIVQSGPPQQMLVQITNLAAYALTAEKDTIVWVNDLANGSAVAAADVSLAGAASLGATNASGVLRAATPAALAGSPSQPPSQPSFLTIRAADGRRLVVPVGLPRWWFEGGFDDAGGGSQEDSANWWYLMRTDRSSYRQTDTANVYGMIRSRSDRSVPHGLELRLRPSEGRFDAPIERVPVTATGRGVFTGAIHFDDLPFGTYVIDLFVGTKRISGTWLSVTEIRKPAFQIDVTTDRHLYVIGQSIKIAASATFYDGTAVPGMDLQFSAFEHTARATTGATGGATASLRAASSWEPEGWFTDIVGVAPAHPEEGEISDDANVVLIPARTWLVATGAISSGRVVVSGTLTSADVKGMEAKLDAGLELGESDGPGRPIAGGKIRAQVILEVPVKRQTGTQYDFIEKRVVPVYDYTIHEVSLGTSTLTSASDGTFRLSVPAPVATDDYVINLSAADPEGRAFHRTVYASPPFPASTIQRRPYLQDQNNGCGYFPTTPVGVEQPFKVAMHQGSGRLATGGRFLFLVAERGSIETTVQDAARFSRTLHDADLPGFTVRAIWLSDSGYAVADAAAVVDPETKRLTIRLQPDRSRYQPGQHATIAVTTTDPSGHPVAADVVVQGVDEKLYTLGIASDMDPVPDLMSSTPNGFLQSYTTHDAPYLEDDGCGGAGGEGRDDFRDIVTFQRITTGPDGRGSVDFGLPDDLTSWHITATGFSGKLDSGIASVKLPVGLPFFVDAVLAPEYLAGEKPVLVVRAFGGALAAGTAVTFTVEAPSLGLGPTTVRGTAFAPVRVPLPKLVAGDHRIRVAGEASRSGTSYHDALIRTVHVASSRLAGLAASYDALDGAFSPKGGEGLTTYAITDAGRGRLVALLQDLAWTNSGRFDRMAAAELARRVLIDEFGFSANGLPATGFDMSRYQREGIALLPYSSADLFLSARAALVMPTMVDQGLLAGALHGWLDEPSVTRERKVVALAGLAGIGEDVLATLRAYDAASLTVREQLWLALGLAAAGDEGAARDIERRLLETAGQRLGPWVRLTSGTTLEETLDASGLLLLLAGRLGDPIAHEVSAYLAAVPSGERVFSLEQIGYASGMLDRLSRDPGRFAWTVDGKRHEVELEGGGGFTLVLTSQQRATLKLERLKGELAVVTTWRTSDAQLPTSSTISVRRTVTPSSNAPDDRLVHIRLEVTFGAQAAPGCYRLVDLTPSGLSAVSASAAWPDEEESATTNLPYSVEGQRVEWCAQPGDRSHVYEYAARVVSAGSYRWEPAVLQFELSPGIGASTPETAFSIR